MEQYNTWIYVWGGPLKCGGPPAIPLYSKGCYLRQDQASGHYLELSFQPGRPSWRDPVLQGPTFSKTLFISHSSPAILFIVYFSQLSLLLLDNSVCFPPQLVNSIFFLSLFSFPFYFIIKTYYSRKLGTLYSNSSPPSLPPLYLTRQI